ncbi:hypothetical protein CQA53_02350 [Helicobacter didelphidarum]|uniref:DUF459 domain-containing protein n=1 Tax=Helicobacter didelphidarum TaxID=2040648 RepID=A0A3D8IR89_9HELI|nr:DUF459 domain-containing protein [Helicobacter didelphidarum]RDU67114.1 hypothetical protein CQA53_02350 [Helicobacter didelphidarum]
MRFVHFAYTALTSMIIVACIFHQSLLNYIVQQYHYTEDITFTDNPLFKFSNGITDAIESYRIMLFDYQDTKNISQKESDKNINVIHQDSIETNIKQHMQQYMIQNSNDIEQSQMQDSSKFTSNPNFFLENIQDNTLLQDSQTDNASISNTTPEHQTYLQDSGAYTTLQSYLQKGVEIKEDTLFVAPNTHFLLIGDSLMQGIAISLVKKLRDKGFKIKNIAKQSTGLTHQSFFNWEHTTKNALRQNPNISVLVVCLGANDPWNMPNKRFGTEAWITAYSERIQKIFDIAKEHRVAVVWYEIPALKDKNLNDKIILLNNLYNNITLMNGGLFIPAKAILVNSQFSTYIKNSEGKSMLARASDGIHFARYGADLLSQSFLDKIVVKQDMIAPKIVKTQETHNELLRKTESSQYLKKDSKDLLKESQGNLIQDVSNHSKDNEQKSASQDEKMDGTPQSLQTDIQSIQNDKSILQNHSDELQDSWQNSKLYPQYDEKSNKNSLQGELQNGIFPEIHHDLNAQQNYIESLENTLDSTTQQENQKEKSNAETLPTQEQQKSIDNPLSSHPFFQN